MACIERRPNCGQRDAEIVPEPLSRIGAVIGIIIGVIGGIATVAGIFEKIQVVNGILQIGGITIGGAAAAGAAAGFVAAIATYIVIATYVVDRCTQGEGLRECLAGVVFEIIESFSDFLDEVFPFSAMHDRVDVVVKSRFWDIVESGQAFVHCTDEAPPRRSEIMRCYYYDRLVCDAAIGSLVGGIAGVVGGIIAAAAVAAAIGCATVILCIIAIIVAAIVAAVAVLVGALIGGQIGKAVSEDETPSLPEGEAIRVGDLITINGNMRRREHDNKANVLWWVSSTTFNGRAPDGLPQPFSYCEIDEVLAVDDCPVPGPD